MTKTEPQCPYCKASYVPYSQCCAQCGSPFPWAVEVERLQEQLKERETNRIRSTATLVDEMFNAAKSGKPVSMAAIKGFVTSWLLPRTVIVVGSLAGAVILAIQTYILWNQTRMLSLQTQAAQLEQSTKLRERISANSLLASRLTRLQSIYSQPLNIPKCDSGDCLKTPVASTLQRLREDVPVAPTEEVKSLWLQISSQLASMGGNARALAKSSEVDFEDKGPEKLLIVTELIRPATIRCLYDPEKSSSLIDKANSFALLTDNGMWVDFPLGKPNDFVEFNKKYPQAKSNSIWGLIQYEEAILSLPQVLGKLHNGQQDEIKRLKDSYRISDFSSDLVELQKRLVASLADLTSACKNLSIQDGKALLVMEERRE